MFQFNTIGFDINKELIKKIKVHKKKHLNSSENPNNRLTVSHLEKLIIDCDIYIVTVPTPVDNNKIPDLDRVIEATKLISKFLSKENIVIYESTFYPGLTEEVCIPLLEKKSTLLILSPHAQYHPFDFNFIDKYSSINEPIKFSIFINFE